MKKFFCLVFVLGLLSIAGSASAHQPRIIYGAQAPTGTVTISNPDISQAFYGELTGQPGKFSLNLKSPLKFYWNLLVPDLLGAREDFVAHLDGESVTGAPVEAVLDSQGKFWTKYYEPHGGDNYFKGPEATIDLPAGNYSLVVTNNGNQGKYVLAVGQAEAFPPSEIWNTILSLPSLKHDYFGQSIWRAYFNRVGQYLAVAALVLIFIFWLLFWRLGQKTWWLIIFVLLVGLSVLAYRFFAGRTDYWQCQDGKWIKIGNPLSVEPGGTCLTPLGLERMAGDKLPTVDQIDSQIQLASNTLPAVRALVQQYLFNNLSTLVPADEIKNPNPIQMTDVLLTDNSTAIVGYQIGDDAFRAEFKFTIDEPESVRSLSFKVIGKN